MARPEGNTSNYHFECWMLVLDKDQHFSSVSSVCDDGNDGAIGIVVVVVVQHHRVVRHPSLVTADGLVASDDSDNDRP